MTAIVLGEAKVSANVLKTVTDSARDGGRVFMDIRNLASAHGVEAVAVEVGPLENQSLEKPMVAGLRDAALTERIVRDLRRRRYRKA